MSTFWEKYKDPRWQKKRLEVMNLAGFACQECEDTTSTLNVHHKFYRKGADPWEYEAHELLCLCETCHSKHHDHKAAIQAQLADADPFELPAIHALIVGYRGGIVADVGIPADFVTDAIFPGDECLHAYATGHLAMVLTDLSAKSVNQLCKLLRELNPDGFAALIATEIEKIQRK